MNLTREMRARRVAVARDVLVQLDREDVPLDVRRGVYMGSPFYAFDEIDREADLRIHVEEVQAKCRVCALGSLLLSKARLYDQVPMNELVGTRGEVYVDRQTVVGNLIDTFNPETLDLIEAAFEMTDGHAETIHWDHWRLKQAVTFGESFDTRKDCLRALCRNLVEHDGELVLERRPAETR